MGILEQLLSKPKIERVKAWCKKAFNLLVIAARDIMDQRSYDTYDYDYYQARYDLPNKRIYGEGKYAYPIMILASQVMKVDNYNKKIEIDEIKKFFVKNFGNEETNQLLRVLKDALNKRYRLDVICHRLQESMGYSYRIHIYHFLYKIARADGEITLKEERLIEEVAKLLGINQRGRTSIRAMFGKFMASSEYGDTNYQWHSSSKRKSKPYAPNSNNYAILGLTKDASFEDVKAAHREKAMEFHPDRVAHLGEGHMRIAEEKFQEIQQAYERLKKRYDKA